MPICGSAPMLMTRNILYTAITRAAKVVVLVGYEQWLRRMIHNNNSRLRNTGLSERLAELYTMYDSNKDGLWAML
jgi:exodeoxyribonuclease V alpha subunit